MLISTPLLMTGFAILFLGVNSEGPVVSRALESLILITVVVSWVALTATGFVTLFVTVFNVTGGIVFAGVGGFLQFRSR